jgi:hypothetical protein
MSKARPQTKNPVLLRLREERGLAVKVAKEIGLEPNAVWMWFDRKRHWTRRKVPAAHVPKVSRLLGIPPHDIRADLYGEQVVKP